MRNRVFLISVAVVLAISLVVVGCDGWYPPSLYIVIGMSRSMTGPLAIIHTSAFGAIYPLYIQMVNDAGGINVGGTPGWVHTKVYSDNSEERRLIAYTNALLDNVEDGEVCTIFGPTSAHMIDVMAPITNNGECVLMTAEGGAAFFHSDPTKLPSWPYVFVNSSFADWNQLPVLAQMLAEAHQACYGGNATPTAYIFWQDDAHGLDYLNEANIFFPANGITIVGNASVLDTLSPDYATLVATANATSPDVVCLFCYPDEVCGLTEAAIGPPTYNFDAWVTGPGGNFGWFGGPGGVGVAAEGVICFATANNKTSEDMEWLFNDVLEPEVGLEGLDFWGHPLYWAALQIWQNAVEEVGQVGEPAGDFLRLVVDQDELRDELASYNSYANGVDTVLGRTWYTMFGDGGGILAYECHPGEVGQWQDGYVEIIGYGNITDDLPNYVVTANFTYPKPVW